MTKKFWLPFISILLTVAVLISPISPVTPVQDWYSPSQSVGEILDPSGNPFAHTFSDTKDIRTATYVVAASDSEHKYMADYRCDSTDDHEEIQAAIDALPATGGEVFLLDGTYNIEVALVMDSYQTLRGCGRNTILTTSTVGIDIIAAIGSDGSEKIGILIADLCTIGDLINQNDNGINWTYVDYSKIVNVWSRDNYTLHGIYLRDSDWNQIINNTCQNNNGSGIHLSRSRNNVVTDNVCQSNVRGISIDDLHNNTITDNICSGNASYGIYIHQADKNVVTDNVCQGNASFGIALDLSTNNTISGNTCVENSQAVDNTYDNIYLEGSDYNLIANNLCRAPTISTTLTVGEPAAETEIAVTDVAGFEVGMGVVIDLGGANVEYHRIVAIAGAAPGVITIDAGLANIQGAGETIDVPRAQYGINIADDTCDKNIIQGNDLHDAGKTANFNDAGTCTIVEDDNREIGVNQVKRYVYMKNTSAAQRVAGDVVIFKSAVAAGDEFTTTVTLGDDHVLGIVAETIAINAYGYVQVAGKTTALKGSNDNGNIVVGDFLCASDTAVEAVKAGALDTAFAIALEALAAAGPTALNALLINPKAMPGNATQSGSYTGDDTVNRAIPHDLGSTPKIVFIYTSTPFDPRWYRIMQGYAFVLSVVAATNSNEEIAVTAPNSTNFYVGNATNYTRAANHTGEVYYWVAIG